MPTTTHSNVRDALLTAWRSSVVATAAGIAGAVWASTAAPRVLDGNAGYRGAIHRGRLPIVELSQVSDAWDHSHYDGGQQSERWRARVWVGGLGISAAEDTARQIIAAGLSETRASARLRVGEEASAGALEADPLGHRVDCEFVVAVRFSRENYGADLDATGGVTAPEVPAGDGLTVNVGFGDAAAVVYTVPADRALDEIEVYVVTPWNGVGAGIEIGVAGDSDRYFAAADSEIGPGASADDAWLRNFAEVGPISILVTPIPGTGATTGTVRLQIKTTALT